MCDHCGAPLAVRSNKIEQCDHCNSQNILKPDTSKELALAKKAKESRASILAMLNQKPSQSFPMTFILACVSKDIPCADMGKFSGYVSACLEDMARAGELEVVRGKAGGYRAKLSKRPLAGSLSISQSA